MPGYRFEGRASRSSATMVTVLLVAAALVGGGCAALNRPIPPLVGGDGGGGGTGARDVRPCAVAAVRSCALPYPSDEFSVVDPSTATGRRLQVPAGILPERITNRLGPGATEEDAFGGADGYAALTPVIFELDRPVDPASLPADGGDVFVVYDATTGQRVPIRAEVPAEAVRHGAPDSVVVAWPRVAYEYGRTYVARISSGLRPHAGGTLARPAGLDDPANAWADGLRRSLVELEPGGWDGVVSATSFTIRSETNATSELDRMAAIARAEDHPIRRVQVGPSFLVDHASAVVTGEVLVSDFRDADGVARAANGSTGRWVKFLLALPKRPAGPDGAPVVIYGHGLTVAKETMVATASTQAALGFATIGIDVPNHGDRQSAFDAGYLLDLTSPGKFGRLASMTTQGIVDQVSLLRAVQDHLGGLELRLPDTLSGPGGPAPRLDTSRLLYVGTSMGGVLGASFTALAPELDGSFLQVPGSGVFDIIFHSMLWPLFMGVVPDGATTGDAYALMGAGSMLLDTADNVNLLRRIRDGDTPVFVAYGVNDGVVPNVTTDRMISLLDLPLVGPQLGRIAVEHRTTATDSVPADGRGVAQIWSSAPMEIQSFGAHIAFAEPRSERMLREWLAGRLRDTGVPQG